MPRPKANDVARYILRYASDRGIAITNLKLQKLLYFCQGWYLVRKGEPLFDGRLEAWPKGAVHYDTWREYRGSGAAPIAVVPPLVDIDVDRRALDAILGDYAPIDQWLLVRLSHGPAWAAARGDLAPSLPSRAEIRLEAMAAEFARLAAERDAISSSAQEEPDLSDSAMESLTAAAPVRAGDHAPVVADGERLLWRVTQADVEIIGDTLARAGSGGERLDDAALRARLGIGAGGVH